MIKNFRYVFNFCDLFSRLEFKSQANLVIKKFINFLNFRGNLLRAIKIKNYFTEKKLIFFVLIGHSISMYRIKFKIFFAKVNFLRAHASHFEKFSFYKRYQNVTKLKNIKSLEIQCFSFSNYFFKRTKVYIGLIFKLKINKEILFRFPIDCIQFEFY